jgi:hypothetical protein
VVEADVVELVAGLLDQFTSVDQEQHRLVGSHGVIDDRRRDHRLAPTGRQRHQETAAAALNCRLYPLNYGPLVVPELGSTLRPD